MKKFILLFLLAISFNTSLAVNYLKFTTNPFGVDASQPLSSQPVVAICNSQHGIDVTDNSTVVTVFLVGNDFHVIGREKLIGTTSVTVVNGVATFTDIKVEGAHLGVKYFLWAWTNEVIIPATSRGWRFGVLPVELTSFTAHSRGTSVVLKWETATETNNYGFEVERKDGTWAKVAFVEGSGTSSSPKSYSFTDRTANGTVKYRLKQIDRDGKYEYSDEIEVNILAPSVFVLNQNFPNPFNPSTTISFTIPTSGFVSLTVFDITGREVKTLIAETLSAGNHSRVLTVADLSSGMYLYRLSTDKFTETKKLTVMK